MKIGLSEAVDVCISRVEKLRDLVAVAGREKENALRLQHVREALHYIEVLLEPGPAPTTYTHREVK